jgi:hypothetical protein
MAAAAVDAKTEKLRPRATASSVTLCGSTTSSIGIFEGISENTINIETYSVALSRIFLVARSSRFRVISRASHSVGLVNRSSEFRPGSVTNF